jgi:molecular chaperone GrpE
MTDNSNDTPREDEPQAVQDAQDAAAENEVDVTASAENEDADDEEGQVENFPGAAASPLEAAEQQNADLKDQLLRALAEMENLRRRSTREKEDASKYAIANFARDMLNVGDNMRRAIDAAPEGAGEGEDAMASLVQGVEMTERELLATLERHGIKAIEPMGEKFDHNLHQAMFEVPDAEKAPGTVVQVIQAGYVIGERLLRPSMVGVSKAAEAAPAEGSDDAGGQVNTSA